MSNNINFLLRIKDLQNNLVADVPLEDLSKDIDIKGSTINYKVINGNYVRGIVQGIGALSAGSTITFNIPAFSNNERDVQDVLERYKVLLNNSRVYKFYIVRYQDDIEYEREVLPNNNIGYKSNFFNNAGDLKLSFTCVDNFYNATTDIIDLVIENIQQGLNEFDYDSITNIETLCKFAIQLNNPAPIYYSFQFYAKTGTGINFTSTVPANARIVFDGFNLTVSSAGADPLTFFYNGSPPNLQIGNTELVLDSSYAGGTFTIRYLPRTDF